MGVDWGSKENTERLMAAWYITSIDHKPDYKRIAQFFGGEATYNSIENRFRPIKAKAEELRADAEANGLPDVPVRTNRKPRAKKNAGNQGGVLDGKDTKPDSTAPSKKRKRDVEEAVKKESDSFAVMQSITEAGTGTGFSTDAGSGVEGNNGFNFFNGHPDAEGIGGIEGIDFTDPELGDFNIDDL